MDGAARIRKTIRNCTAVLIAAIGIATLALNGEQQVGMVMAGAALLYLAPRALVALGKRMDELNLYDSQESAVSSESTDT